MADTAYSALYDSVTHLPLAVYDMQNGNNIAVQYTIPTTQLNTGDIAYLIPVPLGRPLTAMVVSLSADGDNGGTALDPDIVYRIEKTDGTFDDTVLIDSSASSDILDAALTAANGQFLFGDASAWGGKRIVHVDARYSYAHIVYKINTAANAAQETVLSLEARFR